VDLTHSILYFKVCFYFKRYRICDDYT